LETGERKGLGWRSDNIAEKRVIGGKERRSDDTGGLVEMGITSLG